MNTLTFQSILPAVARGKRVGDVVILTFKLRNSVAFSAASTVVPPRPAPAAGGKAIHFSNYKAQTRLDGAAVPPTTSASFRRPRVSIAR